MVVLTNGGQLGQPSQFCFYCGRRVRVATTHHGVKHPPDIRTEDHIYPQCRGGKRTVTACLGCNQDKFSLTLDEFRVVRAFRAGLLPVPDYKFAAEQRVGL